MDASDEFSRAVLQMTSDESKSSARTRLIPVVVDCLRNPVRQQDKRFAVVQWNGRTGAKLNAPEEA